MLKKITTQDRRDRLLEELRKEPEADPMGEVPMDQHELRTLPLCALGLVCKLYPEQIEWQEDVYDGAAKLLGIDGDAEIIWSVNDSSATRGEVAWRLENEVFPRHPVQD